MDKSSGKNITSNLIWNLLERWGAQGVTFVVSIILARLLEPSMYGTVALVTVFTSILSVFIDSGFGSALVQKKNADDLDFSTVFYFNICMCLVLYGIMFFCAPFIARFYGIIELVPIVRVMSLILIIAGVKNILISRIQRNLQYKKFFLATLGGTIGAAVIGIGMAYLGFGVWALVAQSLFNATVDTIVLWITIGWRPKKQFSFVRLKVLFNYGWKILATTLISKIYTNLRQLIIGKRYSAIDLAYYDKASGWPNLLFVNIGGAVDSVMFPIMSRVQDDTYSMKKIMSRTIRLNSFVLFPMLMGLSSCAEPAIRIVLTEKWIACVPFMRIFCFTYAFSVISNTEMNMIRSLGRSDVFLRIEIIKKIIDIIALICSMRFGVLAIAYSLIAAVVLEQVINFIAVKKLLDYPIWRQIEDILPATGCSLVMGVPVYLISKLHIGDVSMLCIQILVGIITYIAIAKICRVESFDFFAKQIGLSKKSK